MAFDIGETVRIYCQAWNASSTPADPDTLSLRIQGPTGAILSFDKDAPADGVTKTSDGHFYKDFEANLSGSWWYEWTAVFSGTPPKTLIEPGQFGVRASVIIEP